MPAQYVVVVPVKPPAVGKSRLVGLRDDQRRALAAAFAVDTVAACLATEAVAEVLVATDDAAFSTRLTALGCVSVPDGDTTDLNAALRQAAAEARRRWPDLLPVALCADLPALRPADLAEALASVPPDAPAYVADAATSGTTLYVAGYDVFDPHFGEESSRAHLIAGARGLPGALPSLRHDVDDLDDLRGAIALGLGAETARLVTRLELG